MRAVLEIWRDGSPLRRTEAALVLLVAAHSLGIGLVLLFATRWGVRLGGWPGATPLFFPRQAGAFHLVVAAGYLTEYLRYRGVSLLVLTKTVAVVFLLVASLVEPVPWVGPVSALGDGLMGLAVGGVHWRLERRPPRQG